MEDIVRLLVLLLQLYLALGFVVIGFALMIGGPERAKRAARWYFQRLIARILQRTWVLLVAILRWPFAQLRRLLRRR